MYTHVCLSGSKKCEFFGKFCVFSKWTIPSCYFSETFSTLRHNASKEISKISRKCRDGFISQKIFVFFSKSNNGILVSNLSEVNYNWYTGMILFLRRSDLLFWCFHCWISPSKCRLGYWITAFGGMKYILS